MERLVYEIPICTSQGYYFILSVNDIVSLYFQCN